MRIRGSAPGEKMKPVRVILEKGGKPYRGPVTYPAGWLPPGTGKEWDRDHIVAGSKPGTGDENWDEVILILQEK